MKRIYTAIASLLIASASAYALNAFQYQATVMNADGSVETLTDARREKIMAANKDMANQALRVLASAVRMHDEQPTDCSPEALEHDLVFCGLSGMIDPERPEVDDDTRALVGKMAKASRARGPQVDSVMQYIRQADCRAVVACGDFNDAPVSYTCQRFSSVLQDAYRQSGSGLGLSYVEKGFYFRLDHVFVSDYWQTYETGVDKSVKLSDHYPLVTYLVKRKK